MQNLHDSSRRPKAAASLFETLEGRQLMSVAPAVAPLAAIRMAPAPALAVHVPLVAKSTPLVSGTAGATAVRVSVAVSTASTGDVPVNPGPAGGTVTAAKSLWDRVKGAAKWVGKHVVIGLNKIGIKGTF